MSHTHRRRNTHNGHQRGRHGLVETTRRKPLVRASRPVRTQNQMAGMMTDHAVVRWLERVVGIDVRAKFVADLLTQERAELASAMQSGKLRVHDTDTILVIRNGVVISVIVDGQD